MSTTIKERKIIKPEHPTKGNQMLRSAVIKGDVEKARNAITSYKADVHSILYAHWKITEPNGKSYFAQKGIEGSLFYEAVRSGNHEMVALFLEHMNGQYEIPTPQKLYVMEALEYLNINLNLPFWVTVYEHTKYLKIVDLMIDAGMFAEQYRNIEVKPISSLFPTTLNEYLQGNGTLANYIRPRVYQIELDATITTPAEETHLAIL